jgi:hypothetical protein
MLALHASQSLSCRRGNDVELPKNQDLQYLAIVCFGKCMGKCIEDSDVKAGNEWSLRCLALGGDFGLR